MAELIALFKPVSVLSGHVVFVHGLGGDPLDSWGLTEAAPDWVTWLTAARPDLAFWTFGYEAAPSRWLGEGMPISDRAVSLLAALSAHGIGSDPSPVCFIAHSMGGLVVKSASRQASARNSEYAALAKRIRGIAFLATPHTGSGLANWVTSLGTIFRVGQNIPEIRQNEASLRDLNTWFRNAHAPSRTLLRVFYETKRTKGAMVVGPDSSDPGIAGVTPIPLDDDHFTICKPSSESALVVKITQALLEEAVPRPELSAFLADSRLRLTLPAPSHPLSGRTRHLMQLRNAFRAASAGMAGSTLVVGEAGAGKSTLVAAFLTDPEVKSAALCAFGQSSPDMGWSDSYGPARQIFSSLLLEPEPIGASGKTVADLISEVMRMLGIGLSPALQALMGLGAARLHATLGAQTSPSPDSAIRDASAQSVLFDAYVSSLKLLSSEKPIVLVLEDLHFADQSTLRLLRYLILHCRGYPVLFIGTTRPSAFDDSGGYGRVGDAFHEWLKIDDSGPQAARFCAQFLSDRYSADLPNDVVASLTKLTDGNARFMNEVCSELERTGAISVGEGGVSVGKWTPLDELPPTVEQVLRERISQLRPDHVAALEIASVEGDTFTLEVLNQIQNLSEASSNELIDQLSSVYRLISYLGTERLPSGTQVTLGRFRHSLTQAFVYGTLGDFKRARLHLKVGETLRQVWGENAPAIANSLYHHFLAGGDTISAIEAGVQLLRQRHAAQGWPEVAQISAGLYNLIRNRGDACVEERADDFCEAAVRLAEAELEGAFVGESELPAHLGLTAINDCLDRALPIADSTRADLHLARGRLLSASELSDGYHGNTDLRRARELYQDSGDQAGVLATLTPYVLDTHPAAQSLGGSQLRAGQECVLLARRIGDPLILARSLRTLADCYLNFDTDDAQPLERARKCAEEAVLLATTAGNRVEELYGRLRLSWIEHHAGHYGDSLIKLRRDLLTDAKRLGQSVLIAESQTDVGHILSFFVGMQDEALESMLQAYEFRYRLGRHAVHDMENLSHALWRLNALHSARLLVEESLERQDSARRVRSLAFLAEIERTAGNEASAKRYLSALLDLRASSSATPDPELRVASALYSAGARSEALAEARAVEARIGMAARRGLLHAYEDLPTGLSRFYRESGDLAKARALIERSQAYLERLAETCPIADLVCYWEYRFELGLVEREEGSSAWRGTLEAALAPLRTSGHRLAQIQALSGFALSKTGDAEHTPYDARSGDIDATIRRRLEALWEST